MKYIDLTVKVNENTKIFPGDPPVKIDQISNIVSNEYEMHSLSLSTHTGTHIDVPSHMIQNGKNLGDFSVESFIGNAQCIPFEILTKDYIEHLERSIDCIFIYTKWQKTASNNEYFTNYPIISEEIARLIANKTIKMFGTDCPSVDHDEFFVHKILLEKDVLILENLTNLEEVLRKQFKVYAFPLNLDTDGSPVRVVAEIN